MSVFEPYLDVCCCIGEVFVSSVYNVPCMYGMSVCLSYETACKFGSYVCTYSVILGIRWTEEYQPVGNKQAEEQQQMFALAGLLTCTRTGE